MHARIEGGRVARITEEMPVLAPGECAQIEECGPEVQEGWLWTPEGFLPTPPPTPAEINAPIDAQILALEARQARPLREHLLGDPAAMQRILAIDAEIAALRAQRVPSTE